MHEQGVRKTVRWCNTDGEGPIVQRGYECPQTTAPCHGRLLAVSYLVDHRLAHRTDLQCEAGGRVGSAEAPAIVGSNRKRAQIPATVAVTGGSCGFVRRPSAERRMCDAPFARVELGDFL